jgi:hypothetical protein
VKGSLSAAATLVALASFFASAAIADVGVGVTLGRVEIDDGLKPGGRYQLPELGVINTGDESGEYEVEVTYLEGQPQLRPPSRWFEFQPQRFSLEPGETQNVQISIVLPTGADPGDYFAYLEAHMVATGQGVAIGAGAATKLSFNIEPSNWFEAQRVRLNRWLDDASPWSVLVPGALMGGLVLMFARRFIRIHVEVGHR